MRSSAPTSTHPDYCPCLDCVKKRLQVNGRPLQICAKKDKNSPIGVDANTQRFAFSTATQAMKIFIPMKSKWIKFSIAILENVLDFCLPETKSDGVGQAALAAPAQDDMKTQSRCDIEKKLNALQAAMGDMKFKLTGLCKDTADIRAQQNERHDTHNVAMDDMTSKLTDLSHDTADIRAQQNGRHQAEMLFYQLQHTHGIAKDLFAIARQTGMDEQSVNTSELVFDNILKLFSNYQLFLVNPYLGGLSMLLSLLKMQGDLNTLHAPKKPMENLGLCLKQLGDQLQQEISLLRENVNQSFAVCFQQLLALHASVEQNAAYTRARLESIESHPLQSKHYILHKYLVESGLTPNEAEVRDALHEVEFWLCDKLHRPVTATGSAKQANQILLDSALHNTTIAGFVSARMRYYLGEIIPEKFTRLPPMEFFITLSFEYLAVIKKLKNVGNYAVVIQKIMDTIEMYLAWFDFMKQNPFVLGSLRRVIQASMEKNDPHSQVVTEELKTLYDVVAARYLQLENDSSLDIVSSPLNITTDFTQAVSADLRMIHLVKYLLKQHSAEFEKQVRAADYRIMLDEYQLPPIPNSVTGKLIPWQRDFSFFGLFGVVVGLSGPDRRCYDEEAVYETWGTSRLTNVHKPKLIFFHFQMFVLCCAAGISMRNHGHGLLTGPAQVYHALSDNIFQALALHGRKDDKTFKTTETNIDEMTQQLFQLYGKKYKYVWMNGCYEDMPKAYQRIEHSDFLNKLKKTFLCFKMLYNGKYKEAEPHLRDIDHLSLLFLTVVSGQTDLFDYVIKSFPVPANFNYGETIAELNFSAVAFAEKQGNSKLSQWLQAKISGAKPLQTDCDRIGFQRSFLAWFRRHHAQCNEQARSDNELSEFPNNRCAGFSQ